jgi:hypothetical protein
LGIGLPFPEKNFFFAEHGTEGNFDSFTRNLIILFRTQSRSRSSLLGFSRVRTHPIETLENNTFQATKGKLFLRKKELVLRREEEEKTGW